MKPKRYGPFSYKPINRRPQIRWPNDNHIALWVIPNIETFPLDEPVPGGTGLAPDVINWATRDYGARIGIFRIMEVMEKFGVKGTVALNSEVCRDYPPIIEDALKLGWEFMGHNQSNSRYLHDVENDVSHNIINSTVTQIAEATGKRPRGWLSSGLQQSWTTLESLIQNDIEYVADFINDDQPYIMEIDGKHICSIPYSIETNDLPQCIRMNRTSQEFLDILRRQFDTLYQESIDSGSGRVMAICLHPFVIGVPHRIGILNEIFTYINGHDGVWYATGSEIIEHYLMGETF